MMERRIRAFHKYLQFLARNASDYKRFNKQLIIGELAGFLAGLLVAEAANATITNINEGDWLVSILSSIADYATGIAGFLAVFYYDNKSSVEDLPTWKRLKQIWRMALSLWPPVVAADIVFLLIRPYLQFQLLSSNIDISVATIVAHFAAFGAFNLVAILSRSIFDFYRYSKSIRST